MLQHGSKIVCPNTHPPLTRPPLTLGWGQNSTVLEPSHVAYQIIGNDACKHIFCSYTHHRHLVWYRTSKLFSSESMHIKLMVMEDRAPCKHTFCPYTHPRSLRWGQRSKHFLLKVVMLHIKLKRMEHRAPYKLTFYPYTHPQPSDGA